MPLSGVHLLLSYSCSQECDHCFLYCGPRAKGTFTLAQIQRLLDQAGAMSEVNEICFEGGEPFLYHPLLVAGLEAAKARGFRTGVVTNCYWATSVEDARLWLAPLAQAGLGDLSVSDDELHHGELEESPARRAARAAAEVGLESSSICIEKPSVQDPQEGKGDPVVGGGVLLKGRAADLLTEGLPTRPRASFKTCPHEELESPKRVHVDAMGHVHVCQGVVIGNVWETPLAEIMGSYDPQAHPVCGPLLRGCPDALVAEHGVSLEGEFVEECHLCFVTRRALLGRLPEALAPRQVYGLEEPAAE